MQSDKISQLCASGKRKVESGKRTWQAEIKLSLDSRSGLRYIGIDKSLPFKATGNLSVC